MNPELQDIVEIINLPSTLSSAAQSWQACMKSIGYSDQHRLHFSDDYIALLGSPGSGKTSLINALLAPDAHGVNRAPEGLGKEVTVPVEYCFGSKSELSVYGWKRHGELEWLVAPGHKQRWPVDVLEALKMALDRGIKVHHIRVQYANPDLKSWRLRLVDMPSVIGDPAQYKQFGEFFQDMKISTGIYLLHSRGESDIDREFAARTQLKNIVYLVNIRDSEISPKRSAFELILAPSHSAIPSCIPLDIHAIKDKKSAEYSIFHSLLAHFRRIHVDPFIVQLDAEANRLEVNLKSLAAQRSEEIFQRIVSNNDLYEHLTASQDLLDLEAWLEEALKAEEILSSVKRAIGRIRQNNLPKWTNLLEADAKELVAEYNIRAGSRKEQKGSKSKSHDRSTIANKIVELRKDLLGMLDNLGESANRLGMGIEEIKSFEALQIQVQENKLEIALLGMFSSGKSALINAFLGVENNDREVKLLPTAVTTETSTINYVEYHEKPCMLGVDWMESVSLHFLSQLNDGTGRWRVHEQEIRAFHKWLTTGVIHDKNYEFEYLSGGQSTGLINKLKRASRTDEFRALWSLVQSAQNDRFYNYLENDIVKGRLLQVRLPVGVSVAQFTKQPPVIGPGQKLSDAFASLKDPAIALRVKQTRVGYPEELLKHAAIIDTPGTDSTVPHHRRMARDLVQHRDCPTIYCFIANQPAGIEDRKNIEHALKSNEKRKMFYTITQKGKLTERQQTEVRRYVSDTLIKIGVIKPKIYFVEAVQYHDPEFDELRKDLSEFLSSQQRPLFESWLDRTDKLINEARRRTAQELKMLDANDREKEETKERLHKAANILKALQNKFHNSETEGIPWVTKRVLGVLNKAEKEMEGELMALQHRDSFKGFESTAESLVSALNLEVRKLVASSAESLRSSLQSHLAKALPRDGLTSPPAYVITGDDFFRASDFLETIREIEESWPSLWFLRFPKTKQNHITQNSSKVTNKWKDVVQKGRKNISKSLKEIESLYTSHMAVIEERLSRELIALDKNDSPERREQLTQSIEHAGGWTIRMSDLRKKLEKVTQ